MAENKIVIDPGHGGLDPGAVSAGVNEKDINLAIALNMAKHFTRIWEGYIPILTRYTDGGMTIEERCKFSNALSPVCFVSIHCNAAANPTATGFEVFTTVGTTKADSLATRIYKEIERAFPGFRLRTDTSDGDPDKEQNFGVLRGTSAPAVLIECGFLTNAEDRQFLQSHVFRDRIAMALAWGIVDWTTHIQYGVS